MRTIELDDLKRLAVFAAVADAGSFTGAAARLGLAKSAVSRHVGLLEEHLGARLLERTTRRVRLTEAGRGLRERANRMLEEAQRGHDELVAQTEAPQGHLRVHAPVGLGAAHVAPALGEYMGRYPLVDAVLDLGDQIVDLLDEEIDVAIRSGKLDDSSLVARRLCPVLTVVCGSPGYFARRGVPRRVDDLREHDWVTYSGLPRRFTFKRDGRRRSIQTSGRVTTNSGDGARALLVAGMGVSAAPLWLVRDDLREGRLEAVLTDYRLPRAGVYAVMPSGRHLLPKTRAFVDLLAHRFEESGWEELPEGCART